MPVPMLRLPLLSASGLCALALLAACGSVGDGNNLKSLRLVPENQDVQQTYTSTKAYQCLRSSLRLIGEFDNGELGDYSSTERDTHWSSSNPAVLRVSNGDEPVPGSTTGASFVGGTLIPVAPGTATITATYLDLSASIEVTVSAPTDITLEPANRRIAVGSTQAYRVTAKLDGLTRDISANAVFAFTEADENVAELAGSTVRGVSAGGPLTLKATLVGDCPVTPTATITVAPLQGLVLSHEQGFTADALAVGFSEVVSVFGDFGDGPEQDLGAQSLLDVANPGSDLLISAVGTRLTAIEAGGPVTVTAVFGRVDADGDGDYTGEGDSPGVRSNTLSLTAVDADLNRFTIEPLDPTIEPLGSQQFVAIGSFDGGSLTHPITRHVIWSSSDTTVATISTGTCGSMVALPGLANSCLDAAGSVTITATNSNATVDTEESTTLTIEPPAP